MYLFTVWVFYFFFFAKLNRCKICLKNVGEIDSYRRVSKSFFIWVLASSSSSTELLTLETNINKKRKKIIPPFSTTRHVWFTTFSLSLSDSFSFFSFFSHLFVNFLFPFFFLFPLFQKSSDVGTERFTDF